MPVTETPPSSGARRSARRGRLLLTAVALVAATLGGPTIAAAQTQPADLVVASGLAEDGTLGLEVGQTKVLELAAPATEVSVGQPDVADVNLISPTRLLVHARGSGRTQLILFAEDGSQTVSIAVNTDLSGLRSQIDEIFPNNRINVTESNGRIVLRGLVLNATQAEQVTAIAASYGDAVNLLEIAGGDQVMLQVVFAEVSKTATESLGFNFGLTGQDGFGGSNIGTVNPLGIEGDSLGSLALGVASPGAGVQLFGVGTAGDIAFAAFLNALAENNLLRVLARPNLVAISGEPASFLAGGEFPIPVAQAGGTGATTVTVEFREFGIKLDFIATALGDGKIRLKCSPEVSDLDFSIAVQTGGFVIPGLTQRRVDTTVELIDGQSMAIAGLLSHNVAANSTAVPYLGEIPVLGALFRSTRYQRRETELVVFVTPRLVAGVNPAEVPAATGENWDHPSREELFLLSKLGETKPGKARAVTPPLYYGRYGFNRADHALATEEGDQ